LIIQSALEDLLENRTAFIIAHRLSTVRKADRIIVIKGGEIIEEGSHRELMERSGLYSQLYQMQFKDIEKSDNQTVTSQGRMRI